MSSKQQKVKLLYLSLRTHRDRIVVFLIFLGSAYLSPQLLFCAIWIILAASINSNFKIFRGMEYSLALIWLMSLGGLVFLIPVPPGYIIFLSLTFLISIILYGRQTKKFLSPINSINQSVLYLILMILFS